jgi:DNA-binding winged helix-turn-helix (wHTH) protein
MKFRFGECLLDGETRELSRKGKAVHISPRGFQLLDLLLSERPRAVSKDEILERLWAGTHVTDGTLTTLVAEIRSAIGDDAREPQFVRTLHRFGYAFSGTAEQEGGPIRVTSVPRVAWRLYWEAREIALAEGKNIIGRDPDAAILVDHVSVSRHHSRIRISGGAATLEDLDSKNGTFWRGERIRRLVQLEDKGEIRFGSVSMVCRKYSLPATTETTPER